jgi:Domain of unknown function (DUF4157)
MERTVQSEKDNQQQPATVSGARRRAARSAAPSSSRLGQLAAGINGSPRVQGLAQMKEDIQRGPRVQSLLQLRQQMQPDPPAQLEEQAAPPANRTGLPDNLKAGVENLSGISLDDVKVHYNSATPAQLNALAYAQGTDIHVAPGQEKYLPHEAWHIVQQKQGRVQPTMQMKDRVPVNDDQTLEREADVMGAKAVQLTAKDDPGKIIHLSRVNYNPETVPVAQRQLNWHEGARTKVKNLTGPILNFTDFGITPVRVNQTEIPPGNAAAALLGPAILINHREDGRVEASIAAEPINFVGYRMELPTDPPWIRQTTVAHAHAALGMISAFGISENVAPDRNEAINVEAKGLPSDAGFAALVEQHEEVHVQELIELIQTILTPWDARIAQFMHQGRVFVGDDENAARALLFEALGGTAAQVGQAFTDGLRVRGLAFHQTVPGSSPSVDSTTFKDGTLRVYWKHPMG